MAIKGIMELDEIIDIILQASDAEISAFMGFNGDESLVIGYRVGLQHAKLWYNAVKGVTE